LAEVRVTLPTTCPFFALTLAVRFVGAVGGCESGGAVVVVVDVAAGSSTP
jgi:hypothetical protein